MNFPLFIARKIYSDQGDKRKVSRPAIRIATIGVAIGLAVMIVTVGVVLGFKHTIRDKVVGFGGHIQIHNILRFNDTDPYFITADDSLMTAIRKIKGVRHTERYTITQGLLKTESDFLGIAFKGVGPEFDSTFLKQNLVEGRIPKFSDTSSHYELRVRTRKYTVSGIYETNMTRFDESLCFIDLYTANKLNGWGPDACTGIEVSVDNLMHLDHIESTFIKQVNRSTDRSGNTLSTQTIYEAYPQVFVWLELLDINVWIILILMVCVAGFTMISGLLIIILERTQMIGILKALGARNKTIRHTFLWFSVFIIGQGMLWGNVLGIGIILLQRYTGIITLDPQTYYVSEAPMELNLPLILLINVATLLICVFVLIAPSYLISHIHPAKSMRYE